MKAYITTTESLPGTATTLTIWDGEVMPAYRHDDMETFLDDDGLFDEEAADVQVEVKGFARTSEWRRKGAQYHCEVARV